MSESSADALDRLLPVPRQVLRESGACRVGASVRPESNVHDPRVDRAAADWLMRLPVGSTAGPRFVVTVEPGVTPHPHGYRLRISTASIQLVGASPAGCFNGLQTLRQLGGEVHGSVPCCAVTDWPDFDTRGLLHDVTRGKVPTLGTLKRLADRLSSLKVNQLQLYIEHAFAFAFDPEICPPEGGLTPHEVQELDAYCHERFIDLVPALATFGHMGRVLSLPRYRHLAEVEADRSWDAMTWPQRARGLTLDSASPEAQRLVERMWAEVLDAFSSPVVNVCGDEPWDLGAGKNRERFRAAGNGPPYMDHIRRTCDLCSAHGRRVQAWSDVVRNHADLLHRLPPDLTILHWGYDDAADYDGTRLFVEAGFDTVVCPGTAGWKRIINALGLAERNIAAFAAAGKQFGAKGLLNTDWGDHGHFHPLACSMHGIAAGAALAWRSDHPIGRVSDPASAPDAPNSLDRSRSDFDRCFAAAVWGIEDATGVDLLRRASAVAERSETWRLMWMPLRTIADDPTLPSVREATAMRDAASRFREWLAELARDRFSDPQDHDELAVAARFVELFADKVALSRADASRAPVATRRDWAVSFAEAAQAYADVWRVRNKPSGLNDILRALEAVRSDLAAQRASAG